MTPSPSKSEPVKDEPRDLVADDLVGELDRIAGVFYRTEIFGDGQYHYEQMVALMLKEIAKYRAFVRDEALLDAQRACSWTTKCFCHERIIGLRASHQQAQRDEEE